MNTAVVIPAAGLSTRFPPNKLLEKLEDRTAIEHTVNTFINFDVDIYVILGYDYETVEAALTRRFGDRLIYEYNTHFHEGMASSLVTGLKAAGLHYDYWCVCPGDKPFIQQQTLAFLLEQLVEEAPLIMVPRHNRKMVHPVFFATDLGPQLETLRGDQGGKSIIEANLEDVLFLELDDEGVTLDMDQFLEFEAGR